MYCFWKKIFEINEFNSFSNINPYLAEVGETYCVELLTFTTVTILVNEAAQVN